MPNDQLEGRRFAFLERLDILLRQQIPLGKASGIVQAPRWIHNPRPALLRTEKANLLVLRKPLPDQAIAMTSRVSPEQAAREVKECDGKVPEDKGLIDLPTVKNGHDDERSPFPPQSGN